MAMGLEAAGSVARLSMSLRTKVSARALGCAVAPPLLQPGIAMLPPFPCPLDFVASYNSSTIGAIRFLLAQPVPIILPATYICNVRNALRYVLMQHTRTNDRPVSRVYHDCRLALT